MKKSIQRMLIIALALTVALLPALALAEMGTDGAGNALATEASAAGLTIGGDLYGVGQNVDASGAQVAESAILAGQNVTVNNGNIGGSLRAAGYQISAVNTTVAVNATLAGYSVSLGQGFAARAVYAAAQSVSFSGACDTLGVTAQNVTIAGTVNGDANIYAETVNVLDTAVITGSLHVTGSNAPTVAAGASVGNVHFTQKADTQGAAAASVASVSTAARFLARLSSLTMMLPGRIILAVLYYFIIRKTIDEAAGMVKTRPAAMPLTGWLALMCLPIAAIILFFTYVGIPVGTLLLCLYGLALAFAVSFSGCMAGKLFFPKLHTLLAYIIGVSAITIVKLIPFVGGVVTFAAMVYTLGYFIQKIYLGFGRQAPAAPAAAQAEAQPPVQQTDTEAL